MKKLATITFIKPWHIAIFIIGAISCIMLLNFCLGMTYNTNGSFDIVTGAFLETFILTVFFQFFNARQQRNVEMHLQAHLRQIEDLIKERGRNE